MITATAKVTEQDRTGDLKALLEGLKDMQVFVGIPEADPARTGNEDITNAQLAYLHTHGARATAMRKAMAPNLRSGMAYDAAYQLYVASQGSPLWHIPPRPIIEPAIEEPTNKAAIAEGLGEALKRALDGDRAGLIRLLKQTGQDASGMVQAWFTDPRNGWPENAESTIARKGSDRPLIDSGQLRTAITSVVVEGKA